MKFGPAGLGIGDVLDQATDTQLTGGGVRGGLLVGQAIGGEPEETPTGPEQLQQIGALVDGCWCSWPVLFMVCLSSSLAGTSQPRDNRCQFLT